jgi:hypothetical protein
VALPRHALRRGRNRITVSASDIDGRRAKRTAIVVG